MSYVKFFPSDWRAGASGELNLEEEGLYVRGCVYMWDTGQPIPGDDAEAARRLRVQALKYKKVMESLIAKGKMIRAQGVIINQRVMEDIDEYRQERIARAERAAAGHANRKEATGRWELLQAEIADLKRALLDAHADSTPHHTPHHTPQQTGGVCPGVTEGVTPGVCDEKPNKNNGAKLQVHSKCTAIPESRIQNPDIDSPLPPQGGEAQAEDFPVKGSARQQRAERAKAAAAEVEQAVETFNKAAGHFGFSPYTSRTVDTDKRLAKRLEAIGGHEKWRAALLALRVDTPLTRFLLGRLPPRNGERVPFRLDIHAFMQTNGNMGDVLQRLLQQAQTAAVAAGTGDQGQQIWDGWDESTWREQIKQHANGMWPTDKIGFWPGHPRMAAPPGLVAAMQQAGELAEYDENGIKKRGR